MLAGEVFLKDIFTVPRTSSPDNGPSFQAFFAEERAELARKRHKIRLLQQRKQGEIMNYKDLPEDIPLQLTIGARVTARYEVIKYS